MRLWKRCCVTDKYESIIITGQLHDDIMRVAAERRRLALEWGQSDKRGIGDRGLAYMQQGLFAEVAVAIELEMEWDWMAEWAPNARDNDVNGIMVRSSGNHDYQLRTTDRDKSGPQVFVTVVRVHPKAVECRIHGWLLLHECNTQAHKTLMPWGEWQYLTPKTELDPIHTLLAHTHRRD